MGTAKRERKKANRQNRLEQLQREQRVRKAKRRGLQFGIIIPVAVAILVLIIVAVNAGDDDNDAAVTTTAPITTEAPLTSDLPTDSAAPTSTPTSVEGQLPCPAEDGSSPKTQAFKAAPPQCIDPAAVYVATVTTNKGEFTIELDASVAPQTVNNFVYLARYRYYDGITCHRIIPGFVVQCGDPQGNGSGGPGYSFPDELPAEGAYQLGSLAMANSGPDTNGSQFFIITGPNGVGLPPKYSLFGQVTAGFDSTVKSMEAAGSESGAPTEPITIESVVISVKGSETPAPTTAPTLEAPAN